MNNNYQKLKQKYKNYGVLNADGKKQFGEIFPDGIVPLASIIPEEGTLEGGEGTHKVFRVVNDLLTEDQLNHLIKRISDRSGMHLDMVQDCVIKDGFIPMSSRWICGSGTDQLRMFG